MPRTADHKTAFASAYARSLLELANETNQAEPIRQELQALKQVCEQNPTFGLFLAAPAISHAEREPVLNRIFGQNLSPLMHNFVGVLNRKNRLSALPRIAQAYAQLLDEQLGKLDVDVTVAHALAPAQLDEVQSKVGQALKKNAVIHQSVDDSIIGGLIIRVQDKLIDASVKTQLAAMKEQLLAAGGNGRGG